MWSAVSSKRVGDPWAEQDLAVPYIQVKGKPFGVCSPIPATLQEVSPTAPSARDPPHSRAFSFPSLCLDAFGCQLL